MTLDGATLINLLGFLTGVALYGMLLFMVLAGRVSHPTRGIPEEISRSTDRLPLLTAILGLCWNISGILVNGLPTLVQVALSRGSVSLLAATAFTSLGYLPAVVVHSVLRTTDSMKRRSGRLFIVSVAYLLSTVACIMHFYSAIVFGIAPSHVALHLLTYGFGSLIVVLLISTRGQANWRAGWIVALAGFAISAVHLSHHGGESYAWWLELVGHHASLPLILAILYQDFRFALADIFLKRAFSLLILVSIAVALYVMVANPFLYPHNGSEEANPRAIGLLLTLWVGTALIYPWLRRRVDWFVDTVVLRRADYGLLRSEIVRLISEREAPDAVLDTVCERLAPALSALKVSWISSEMAVDPGQQAKNSNQLFSLTNRFDKTGEVILTPGSPVVTPGISGSEENRQIHLTRSFDVTTSVFIPTSEAPQYFLVVGGLQGGRRMLSDDTAMLESLALLVARRIDALRVSHERCEVAMREQETSKLVTEAELRALRAQLNPHFLFNALTTISYLVQTSPKRAQNTLMRLTGLLRGVLKRSTGEFTTLGEELDLIEDYLEIEQARFEERLGVKIDVPLDIRDLRVPSLILQPLVENAVKHGISPMKSGGEVTVMASLVNVRHYPSEVSVPPTEREEHYILKISVRDTGKGVTDDELSLGRKRGVGLNNIERRLQCHYGDDASLLISSVAGSGTICEISLPVAVPIGKNLDSQVTDTVQLISSQPVVESNEHRVL